MKAIYLCEWLCEDGVALKRRTAEGFPARHRLWPSGGTASSAHFRSLLVQVASGDLLLDHCLMSCRALFALRTGFRSSISTEARYAPAERSGPWAAHQHERR